MANETAAEKNLRSFKGIWIPREIWLNTKLNLTQKVLFVEIDSLDNEDGCYATNDYFAKFLDRDKMYISQCVTHLIEQGLIYVDQEKLSKRVLRSNMKILFSDKVVTVKPKKEKTQYPTMQECVDYFVEHGYKSDVGQKAWNFYHSANWCDSRGKKVINWKQKMQGVWFKEENKVTLPAPKGRTGNTFPHGNLFQ